jgi:hypothetical protein
VRNTGLFEPDASFGYLDVPEHRGRGKLVKQALGGLVGIRRKSCDINEPGYTSIGARVSDQRSAVGVADQDGRAVDASKTGLHGGDVSRE